MKTATLKNRLEKNYKGSKSTFAYGIAKEIIGGYTQKDRSGKEIPFKSWGIFGDIIRPVKCSGSGRFSSNLDYTNQTIEMLNLLGLKFEVGNDAKRGGLTGNFIKIISKIEK